jgi:exopolyphosphatase/guanosine-5'-triphosphate,3'-diphosphate pyrophosphatase
MAKADPVTAEPRVLASVDLGSNSVHLLVAGVSNHLLSPLDDESVFLGLGSAVASRGYLGKAARAALITALERYAAVARDLGADAVSFIGTEPIRRAADSATTVHEVTAATGAPLFVLSHEEEAYLTIIGVTEGRPVAHETLVVDIGGGSSEFCVVDAARPPRAIGLRLGSARLTDRFVSHDPPEPAEIEAMYAAALDAVADAPAARPVEIVAVGGTASNLRKVVPTASDGVLGPERIAEALMLLGSMSGAAATVRFGVNPIRARILPAGAAILAAILDRYEVSEVRISEAGIREGAILAVAHAGPAWRDRLVELTRGWRV